MNGATNRKFWNFLEYPFSSSSLHFLTRISYGNSTKLNKLWVRLRQTRCREERLMEKKELSMDISGINFEQPRRFKIELMLKKAREGLNQLKELETKLEGMEAPRSFECSNNKFKPYWKVSKEIDKLYKWMRNIELSNYPITSQNELKEYIEHWECVLDERGEKDGN